MRNKMLFATFTLSLSFAAVAAGQDHGTPILEQVTVSPVVTSRPVSCDHQHWPSSAEIRRKLDLPRNASAGVAQKRLEAIKESRALCRQTYTHVQWAYRKVGRQVVLAVR